MSCACVTDSGSVALLIPSRWGCSAVEGAHLLMAGLRSAITRSENNELESGSCASSGETTSSFEGADGVAPCACIEYSPLNAGNGCGLFDECATLLSAVEESSLVAVRSSSRTHPVAGTQ
eukprot:scaffold68538_cov29-Tisochrysis_lutea.AAC.3